MNDYLTWPRVIFYLGLFAFIYFGFIFKTKNQKEIAIQKTISDAEKSKVFWEQDKEPNHIRIRM